MASKATSCWSLTHFVLMFFFNLAVVCTMSEASSDHNDKEGSEHGAEGEHGEDEHGDGEHGGHRYYVAKFDFLYIKAYFVVGIWVLYASGVKICKWVLALWVLYVSGVKICKWVLAL